MLNPIPEFESLTLISVMSAQLLICKFAVFLYLFLLYFCKGNARLAWLAGSQFVKTWGGSRGGSGGSVEPPKLNEMLLSDPIFEET